MALQLFVQPRAGELIAQGIDGLAQGIEKYYQRKEENAKMEQAADFFARAAESNPELARSLNIRDPKDKAALKAGIKAAGGPMQFMQMGAAMQQMMERQQAAEQERKQRFALQDAADPIMQMANRQLTPEQFTSGQALGSNDFLRNAIAMGADPRMAAPVANVMQDTEIAGLRAEAAAAKAATSNVYRSKEDAQAALDELGGKGTIQQTEKGWIISATRAPDKPLVDPAFRPMESLPAGKDGKPRYGFVMAPDGNWRFIDLERGDGGINFSFSPAGVTASQ